MPPNSLTAPALAGLIAKMAAIRNRYDAYDMLLEICRLSGYTHGVMLDMPVEASQHLADHILISNWPERFLRDYDAFGLLATSPVIASARDAIVPFLWSFKKSTARRNQVETKRAAALFEEFGFLTGVALPTGGRPGERRLLFLAGDRDEPQCAELSYLLMLTAHLSERLLNVLENSCRDEPAARLSDRERQCLVWTSAGKTSLEIGTILGLSEHTVNQYIASSSQKLGAVNRAHAVAKAMRRGLIE
ncbi:MAG: autoinducer binding domain-containing protein [Nitratireductor sp.]